MQRICNPFWKDILKHYKKLYTKCLPEKILNDFVSECTHYNININVNKRVVYIKDWFNAGIIFVHHLMDNNGNYLTFVTFKQLCVIGTINKYQHRTKVELVANYKVQEPKVWMYIQRGDKYLKSLSVKSEALPCGA